MCTKADSHGCGIYKTHDVLHLIYILSLRMDLFTSLELLSTSSGLHFKTRAMAVNAEFGS